MVLTEDIWGEPTRLTLHTTRPTYYERHRRHQSPRRHRRVDLRDGETAQVGPDVYGPVPVPRAQAQYALVRRVARLRRLEMLRAMQRGRRHLQVRHEARRRRVLRSPAEPGAARGRGTQAAHAGRAGAGRQPRPPAPTARSRGQVLPSPVEQRAAGRARARTPRQTRIDGESRRDVRAG